jgi:hypothetical protein
MGFARERVVPRLPDQAWVRFGGLGIAAGVGLALAGEFAVHRILDLMGGPALSPLANTPQNATTLVLVLVLCLTPVMIVLRVTQRWSTTTAFAVACFLAALLVSMGREILKRGDGGADVHDWAQPYWLESFGIAFVGPVVLALILHVLCRALLVRTIERAAGMCAWCGYTLGSHAITRCPECGRDVEPARYRMHAFLMIARHSNVWAVLAIAIVIALAVSPMVHKTLPSARFYAAFPRAERVGRYPNAYMLPDLPSVWIAHPTMNDRGLRVTFEPDTRGAGMHMSVDVVGAPASGLSYGSGHVITDLDEAQTKLVLKSGLPDALMRALYAKADEIAWTPNSVARGAWEVDAGPCFPR